MEQNFIVSEQDKRDYLDFVERNRAGERVIIETHDLKFKEAYEGWVAAGQHPSDVERFGLKLEDICENPDCFEIQWALELGL